MKTIKEGPVLRDESKTGKMKHWQLLLLTDGKDFFIQKTWWLGEDGKKTEATPTKIEGKNAGRSNATTNMEQAELAFTRAIKRRQDKGFSLDGTSTHVPTKPMLALSFEKRKDRITKWPVFVQPKYDGHRMLMDGARAWTRGGKDHVVANVKHLMFDTDGYTLDGEIMLPKGRYLAETSSAIKNPKSQMQGKLVFYVYDVVVDLPYAERYELLKELLADAPANVELVPTVTAQNPEEVMEFHGAAVKAGFEGAIVRLDGSGYEVGARTDQLLKVKAFQDEEFQVVSVDEGEGSNVGLAILVLELPNGKTFNAVPEGGMALRRELWKNRHDLLGQFWTVRYFYKSKDGVPIYPIAVTERHPGE